MHVCLSLPPQYYIAKEVGFLKGKKAIRLDRKFISKKAETKHFLICGYHVSTTGLEKKRVREYIRNQEKLDKNQMGLDLQ